MSAEQKLFESFPPVTAAQWKAQVIKDLKGDSFEDKLNYTTPDGIVVQPFYTQEDFHGNINKSSLFDHSDWDITDAFVVKNEEDSNRDILKALNSGATSLKLSVAAEVSLPTLLEQVELPYIDIQFTVCGDAVFFARQFTNYIQSKGYATDQLKVGIQSDYIHLALATGEWGKDEASDRNNWKQLFTEAPHYRTIYINGTIYHNAGASPAYQLGCILAHAHEYIATASEEQSFRDKTINLQIDIATGPDYFFEIAKLRALRKLLPLVLNAYNLSATLHIHAVTAFRNLTAFDNYNNLLRNTTEAMAAIIGGCNSLEILPFDAAIHNTSDFSRRMSRNIQLILKHESHFDKVADISAGSFYIETLTEQLAEQGWSYFQTLEKTGGFVAAIQQGMVQHTIAAFSQAEQQQFEEGKKILVGTNKYPNASEHPEKDWSFHNACHSPSGNTIIPLHTTRLAVPNEQSRVNAEKQSA